MSNYINTDRLDTPATFQTFSNYINGNGTNVGKDNRVVLTPHYYDNNTSSSQIRFAFTLPQTPTTSTFYLAAPSPRHGAYLRMGISQRTNSPVNVRIRRFIAKYYLNAYTEGDSDGGGKFMQEKYQHGTTMVVGYEAYYGASNYTVPETRLPGYMHYIFNFDNGQSHTVYAHLDILGPGGAQTWVAWFD